SRHRRKRHLATQAQHQRLEQQREAAELSRPGRLDQPHRTIWKLDARHPDFKEALVLEKVQMSVPLGLSVVHRMLAGAPGMGEAAARPEVDLDRQGSSFTIETRLTHEPRRRHTKCRLEQLLRLHSLCRLRRQHWARRHYVTHSDFERGSFLRAAWRG